MTSEEKKEPQATPEQTEWDRIAAEQDLDLKHNPDNKAQTGAPPADTLSARCKGTTDGSHQWNGDTHICAICGMTAEDAKEGQAFVDLIERSPPAFGPIIRRYGADIYKYCWITGGLGGCLGTEEQIVAELLSLAASGGGRTRSMAVTQLARGFTQAHGVLSRLSNDLAKAYLEQRGWDLAVIRGCQEDISRASALTSAGQTDITH